MGCSANFATIAKMTLATSDPAGKVTGLDDAPVTDAALVRRCDVKDASARTPSLRSHEDLTFNNLNAASETSRAALRDDDRLPAGRNKGSRIVCQVDCQRPATERLRLDRRRRVLDS